MSLALGLPGKAYTVNYFNALKHLDAQVDVARPWLLHNSHSANYFNAINIQKLFKFDTIGKERSNSV